MAEAVYRRFATDNQVSDRAAKTQAQRALHTLENEPVIVTGEAPMARPKAGEQASDRIRRRLRRDLLGDKPTVVFKALMTVRAFRLRQHAPELLIIVYRRQPYRTDGGLLSEISTATRSVAIKWAAIQVLRGWMR